MYFLLLVLITFSIFIIDLLSLSADIITWIHLVHLSFAFFDRLLLHDLSTINLLIEIGLRSPLVVEYVSIQCKSLESPLVRLIVIGVQAFFHVYYWHYSILVLVEHLLLILNVLHAVLVARIDIYSGIIDLMDFTLMVEVAHWIFDHVVHVKHFIHRIYIEVWIQRSCLVARQLVVPPEVLHVVLGNLC